MTITHAIILGIVQGLGEFLPISSSAHLVIVPWLLDFQDPGLTFDVALHLGTLISLLIYFRKDWVKIISAFFRSLRKKPSQYDFEERLAWLILIASIPGAIAGKLLEKHAEELFRSPTLIATMMVVMGVLLGLTDRYSKKEKKLDQITLKDSILIGMSQALALIPGVSRSGSTITTGLLRNLNRESAARFSFLMSAPITAGAVLLKSKHILQTPFALPNIVGILVSAVVGYLSIKYMLYYLQKYSYAVFVVYRMCFAAVVFLVIFLRT